MNIEAIKKAVDHAGGQSALARKLGCTPQAVQKWCSTGRVPLNRLLDIETATGVPRQELCPELFEQEPAPAA